MLHACSPCHVSRLELRGAVPHSSVSRATAEAVQACCPHLTSLNLDHMIASGNGSHYEAVPPREAASGYHDGCVQLLTLCGPRLTYLRLHGVHHWQPPSYMAVRHCTALTWLDFEAKHTNDKSGDVVVEDQIGVWAVWRCGLNNKHVVPEAYQAGSFAPWGPYSMVRSPTAGSRTSCRDRIWIAVSVRACIVPMYIT